MCYEIREVRLNNVAEICWESKRTDSIVSPVRLRVGGLYFLRGKRLYRVENEIE